MRCYVPHCIYTIGPKLMKGQCVPSLDSVFVYISIPEESFIKQFFMSLLTGHTSRDNILQFILLYKKLNCIKSRIWSNTETVAKHPDMTLSIKYIGEHCRPHKA